MPVRACFVTSSLISTLILPFGYLAANLNLEAA
jgi:hypothetical protein